MKSGISLYAGSALLVVAVGALHSPGALAQQFTQGTQQSPAKVYVGADAIRKELEVLEQVIADTATRIVAGTAEKDALAVLVSRKASLQKQQLEPETAPESFQSQTISACGQTLQLNVNALQSSGTATASASSQVQLSNAYPALVQGLVYSITKNYYHVESSFRTFTFHSQKLPPGPYSTVAASTSQSSWSSCGKAYATGAISDLNGNTLECGTVPIIIETEYQHNSPYDCSSAL